MFGNPSNYQQQRNTLDNSPLGIPRNNLGLFNRDPSPRNVSYTSSIFGRSNPQTSLKTKIFNDTNSPWHKLLPQVKEQFHQESIKSDVIQISKIRYEPKINLQQDYKRNMCINNIQGLQYYKCWTCLRKRKQIKIEIGICELCFDPKEHEDHYYKKLQLNSHGFFGARTDSMCCCGKDLFEDYHQFKCKAHSKQIQIFEVDAQQQEYFMSFWQPLFEVFFYLQSETYPNVFPDIGRKIYEELQFLAEKNIQYVRMIDKLFWREFEIKMEKYAEKVQKRNIYTLFFHSYREERNDKVCEKLMSAMVSDLYVGKKIAKLVNQLSKSNFFCISNMASSFRYNFQLSSLIFENTNCSKIFNVEETALLFRKAKPLEQLRKYLEHCYSNPDRQQDIFINYLIKLFAFIRNGKLVKSCSTFLLSFMLKYNTQNNEQCSQQQQNSENQGRNQQKKLKNQLTDSLEYRRLVNKSIFSYCDHQPSKIIEFPQKINDLLNNESQQNKVNYAQLLFKIIQKNLNSTKSISYPHLMLLVKSHKKTQIMKIYAKEMFKSERQTLFGSSQFQYDYSKFIYLVVGIIHHRFYFQKFEDLDFQTDQQLEPQRKYRQNLLKQCIYQIKSLQNALAVKNQFKIPNFDKIISQMMSFNHEEKKFFFKQNCEYPNKLTIFLTGIFNKGTQSQSVLRSFNVESEECFKSLGEFQIMLANEILVNSSLLDEVQVAWKTVRQKNFNKEQLKNNNFSAKYLQTLIIVDLLTQHKNQKLCNQIKNYIQQEELRKQLYDYGSTQVINNLLCLKPKPKTQQQIQKQKQANLQLQQLKEAEKSKQQQLSAQIKQKSDLLKKQKYIKMKEKQKLFMEKYSKLATQSFNKQISDEGEQCILCHEKGKKNNRLVYLVKIVSKFTENRVLFGEANVAETKVTSCFHPIHFNCFTKEIQKQFIRKCPLCSKIINAILPQNYFAEEKKMNRVCTNMLINSFFSTYKVFDIQNLFIPLYKHLIESKSFTSLVNIKRYSESKRKRQRLDLYIQNFISEMYQLASQQTKKQYDEEIQQLIESINKVQNQQYKQIQMMFVEGLNNRLRNQSIKECQYLGRLSEKLRKQDFMVVQNQAEEMGMYLPEKDRNEMNVQMKANEQEKIKLSKQYPIKPPKYAYQLRTFGSETCSFCSIQNKTSICLICGVTMCGSCEMSQKHSQNHSERMLTFLFNASTIQYQTQTVQTASNLFGRQGPQKSSSLYFNKIMVPFENITFPDTNRDVFELNQQIYSKFQGYLMD